MSEPIEAIRKDLAEILDRLDALEGVEKTAAPARVSAPADTSGDGPWPKPHFGGRYAPWAVPLSAGMKKHPQSAKYEREFRAMCNGRINVNAYGWGTVVYDYDDSTPMAGIRFKEDKYEKWGNLTGKDKIPWNPKWSHGTDSDSYSIIADKKTGRCYIVWGSGYDPQKKIMYCKSATLIKAGVEKGGNDIANIWQKENGYRTSRAAGIAAPHGLTTRAEVEAGLIPHCLFVGLPQPSRDTRLAPATKFIGRTGSAEKGRLGMGVRIAFDISDDELEKWISKHDGALKKHARTFGTALAKYGIMVVDNGGKRDKKNGGFQCEQDNTAHWEEIGLPKKKAKNLLHSLIVPNMNNCWVVEEPEHKGGSQNNVAVYKNARGYPKGYL